MVGQNEPPSQHQQSVRTVVAHMMTPGVIQVPGDVSFVSIMPDPVFRLRQPILAHFHYPEEKPVRCIVRWVEGVAKGQNSRRQTILNAAFVKGETIGAAKR